MHIKRDISNWNIIIILSVLIGACNPELLPKKWPRGSDWSDSKFSVLHSTGKLYWVILDYLPLLKHWL